jgi:hypothetical protein
MLAAWARKNSRQPGPDLRGAGPSPAREQPTDSRWRHCEAEFGQLTGEPPMAPARILPCQPQHQGPHLGRHRRASTPAGRLPPLSAHECPVPAQQRPRSNQTRPARGAWQVAGRRGERRTISAPKLRPRDLATQDLELVAQDQQLDVLDVQATGTPNQCAQQGPEREVEKGEGHVFDPPHLAQTGATRVMAPLRGYHPSASRGSTATVVRRA